jgi:pilus assembly protein Flp/PilA
MVARPALVPPGVFALPGSSTQVCRGPTQLFLDALSFSGPERSLTMLARLSQTLVNLLKSEDGPTAVEYAVMLALIIVVCIGAIQAVGGAANNIFLNVAGALGS